MSKKIRGDGISVLMQAGSRDRLVKVAHGHYLGRVYFEEKDHSVGPGKSSRLGLSHRMVPSSSSIQWHLQGVWLSSG